MPKRSCRSHKLPSIAPAGQNAVPPAVATTTTSEVQCNRSHDRNSVGGADRSQGVWPQRAQAELQHDGVIADRSRHCRVGITAEPIDRQHEAVVDIADTESRLVEAIVLDIIARRTEQDPISRQLQRRAGQEAFASRKESEKRLGRVVAIEELQRPALEIGASLDLKSLRCERSLVETAA